MLFADELPVESNDAEVHVLLEKLGSKSKLASCTKTEIRNCNEFEISACR